MHRAWGQAGGRDGSPNFVEVVRAGGGAERFALATPLPLNEGDLIRIHTGNGGGFGAPEGCEQELVLADLRNGFAFP